MSNQLVKRNVGLSIRGNGRDHHQSQEIKDLRAIVMEMMNKKKYSRVRTLIYSFPGLGEWWEKNTLRREDDRRIHDQQVKVDDMQFEIEYQKLLTQMKKTEIEDQMIELLAEAKLELEQTLLEAQLAEAKVRIAKAENELGVFNTATTRNIPISVQQNINSLKEDVDSAILDFMMNSYNAKDAAEKAYNEQVEKIKAKPIDLNKKLEEIQEARRVCDAFLAGYKPGGKSK